MDIIEGTTDPIIDQLLLDGVATESLSGHSVACLLWDKNGAAKTASGTAAIHDAATRKVRFTPASATALLASESPYSQRWKVTRPSGEVYFVPSTGATVKWNVKKP